MNSQSFHGVTTLRLETPERNVRKSDGEVYYSAGLEIGWVSHSGNYERTSISFFGKTKKDLTIKEVKSIV